MGEMTDDISTEWWEEEPQSEENPEFTPLTLATTTDGLVRALRYLIDEYGYAGVKRTLEEMKAHK